MKRTAAKFIVLALFFALATTLSCGGEEREPQAPPPHEEETMEHRDETIQEDINGVKKETEFTTEQKEAYIDTAHEQMLVMEENIQELKVQVQNLEGQAREEMDQELDELGALYEKASSNLSDLKDQSLKAWFETKQSLENSLYQLEQAYQDIKARLE
jgi:chromosome segregation ATPase